MSLKLLLLTHAAATLIMVGVIWVIQVVHYPLMRRVGGGGFARYEEDHTRRTSPVVAPVMIFELGTGLWLALDPPVLFGAHWLWANAAGLAVIWVSTFALQVPIHRHLAAGYDERAIGRLVAGNWVRTAAWSARALLLMVLLLSALREVTGTPVTAGTTGPASVAKGRPGP